IMKRLRPMLDKMGLRDVALRVQHYIDPEQFQAERVEGYYDPVNALIAIAQDAENPAWVIGHEAVHALRAMDLFLPVEYRALENSITAQEMARIQSLYPGVNHEGQVEEAIAEKYG